MRLRLFHTLYPRCCLLIVLCALLSLAGCGGFQPGSDAFTSVEPLSGEDLASACKYDLVLPDKTLPQQGVLVIFERGDSSVLYHDLEIRQLAASVHFAMVFAHQCNAASYDDIQSVAADGPGRALFQALTQFAKLTSHPELATAHVILYGFSAAAVLSAELSSYAPERTIGYIAYAAGNTHFDFSTFTPQPASLAVPALFLDSSTDDQAGTFRSLKYYAAGKAKGALWGFGVQNGVGHCCNITTKPMLLSWIPGVLNLNLNASNLSNIESAAENLAAFVCTPDGVIDAQHEEDCSVTAAVVGAPAQSKQFAAWLPGSAIAKQWLQWVTAPTRSH